MFIKSVHFHNFRGLKNTDLVGCSALNILIGRNNSGKSSALSGLDFALRHLSGERISTKWDALRRGEDKVIRRYTEAPFEVGLVFEMSQELAESLCEDIAAETNGLEVAIEQLKAFSTCAVVVSGAVHDGKPFRFTKELGLGAVKRATNGLSVDGRAISSIPFEAAVELLQKELSSASFQDDLRNLEKVRVDFFERPYLARDTAEPGWPLTQVRRYLPESSVRVLERALANRAGTKEGRNVDPEQVNFAIEAHANSLKEAIAAQQSEPTKTLIGTFSGHLRAVPDYVLKFMAKVGETEVLFLSEDRAPLGPDEANQILRLKTQRGGTQRLTNLQATVKELLGVTLDAFEAAVETSRPTPTRVAERSGARSAEMDIDEFLIEANGAGVRESLRLVLDFELKSPGLLLLEEPEVHLHPGLEKVMHRYLQQKSSMAQIFVATHSTNFLDASGLQNIYVLSKVDSNSSKIKLLAENNELPLIPEELGLRPSSILMFDELVFVEGASDEAIIREFARTLNVDLLRKNIAFVSMGGATRFAQFATDSTLSLLSRRQIPLWFVLDRDELSADDVSTLTKRLGSQARLHVLERRELENYLMIPRAIASFLSRRSKRGAVADNIDAADVAHAISTATDGLKERVIELRSIRSLLSPVFADRFDGGVEQRLVAAKATIEERLTDVASKIDEITKSVDSKWETDREVVAPGSEILSKVFQKFGARYRKDVDGQQLAAEMKSDEIPQEIRKLLGYLAS